MQGWIALHRDIIEWQWFHDNNTFRLFIYLNLMANYCEKNWKGVVIKRGQFLTSLKKLSAELDLSIQQIRTSLEKLESTNDITRESTNKSTLITLVKYRDEQSNKNNETNENNFYQQSNNIQITPTNNNKNNNNIKNEYIGEPDDTQLDATEILEFLNFRARKNYKIVDGNMKLILARLKEGYKKEELKSVIDTKTKEWLDCEKMNQYLRPKTLFNLDNFPGYLEKTKGEIDNGRISDHEGKGANDQQIEKDSEGIYFRSELLRGFAESEGT